MTPNLNEASNHKSSNIFSPSIPINFFQHHLLDVSSARLNLSLFITLDLQDPSIFNSNCCNRLLTCELAPRNASLHKHSPDGLNCVPSKIWILPGFGSFQAPLPPNPSGRLFCPWQHLHPWYMAGLCFLICYKFLPASLGPGNMKLLDLI